MPMYMSVHAHTMNILSKSVEGRLRTTELRSLLEGRVQIGVERERGGGVSSLTWLCHTQMTQMTDRTHARNGLAES